MHGSFPQDNPHLEALPAEAREQIAGLLREGRKIEAIRLLREAVGCGLAEAKEAVDRLETAAGPGCARDGGGSETIGDALRAEVCVPESCQRVSALLREGRKIEAIKVMRESAGCGLAEAKEAVEHLESQLGLAGRSGRAVGCSGAALSALTLAGLLLATVLH